MNNKDNKGINCEYCKTHDCTEGYCPCPTCHNPSHLIEAEQIFTKKDFIRASDFKDKPPSVSMKQTDIEQGSVEERFEKQFNHDKEYCAAHSEGLDCCLDKEHEKRGLIINFINSEITTALERQLNEVHNKIVEIDRKMSRGEINDIERMIQTEEYFLEAFNPNEK